MSSAFYAGLATTALRLITDKGKAVIIRRPSHTTPVKPYSPAVTTVDTTVRAVVTEFAAKEIDDTTVRTGDRKYLVAASGVAIVPGPSDKLVDGSEVLEIVSVESVNPGGTEIVWTVHARPTGGD